MTQLKRMEDKVKYVLERYPDTKDNDAVLLAKYCGLYYPEICDIPFYEALHVADLPSYESISRVRRKLQERHPELRGARYNKKQEAQTDYVEYALDYNSNYSQLAFV